MHSTVHGTPERSLRQSVERSHWALFSRVYDLLFSWCLPQCRLVKRTHISRPGAAGCSAGCRVRHPFCRQVSPCNRVQRQRKLDIHPRRSARHKTGGIFQKDVCLQLPDFRPIRKTSSKSGGAGRSTQTLETDLLWLQRSGLQAHLGFSRSQTDRLRRKTRWTLCFGQCIWLNYSSTYPDQANPKETSGALWSQTPFDKNTLSTALG